jgi:hypothetical protein
VVLGEMGRIRGLWRWLFRRIRLEGIGMLVMVSLGRLRVILYHNLLNKYKTIHYKYNKSSMISKTNQYKMY